MPFLSILLSFVAALFAALGAVAMTTFSLGRVVLGIIAFIATFLIIHTVIVRTVDSAHEKKVLAEYLRKQYGEPPSRQ
jgi:hypothetical protein